MDKQDEINRKDRDIARRTKEGMAATFPKPGVNWGDKLKGLLGMDTGNKPMKDALAKRSARY